MKVEANGIPMNVVVQGLQDAPVVTLSHSLAARLEMWRPQMAELTRRYRVIRYDVRGHGGTEKPSGPFNLRDLADDVHALLGQLGISRTHFVGLSLGGMIGQQLAVDCPELLESMVLADTLSAYGPEAIEMWEKRIASASSPEGMEALVEPTVTRWFTAEFREARPDQIEWVRGMIRDTHPEGFIGVCRAVMRLNLTERLRAVSIPTLILVGRQDPTTPVSGSEVIRDAISGSQMRVIENAAHLSNIEQPEVFSKALQGFLAEQTSSVART